ncbi:hypothetical protein ABH19_06640 [Leptospirillum sp. Group II 'CF-1']|jgi:hypothetical protein|uniref:DUF3467 domain-containing protein n=1 Tax=Leptospirillum sp. Group II 'CF-1' TaxID=1660083 RepID=UPI0006727477|nr:DUF3467 domain-containing protein [Leptospirillum sp. Group II 'CF-1']AKS23495.1 hypothetical protein ABH19_06640 [Leptospirillum sp. Group II 'CF-1']
MENKEKITVPPISSSSDPEQIRRDEEVFISSYANHILVESNPFDLKLIFGLLDHRNPLKPAVDQFSSVNIPWTEVKLLIYFLKLHLAVYELENGKVKIPATVLPPEIPPTPPPELDNPQGRAAFDLLRKMRAEFIASLTE